MQTKIEHLILSGLITFPEFTAKAITILKPDYFKEPSDKQIFQLIKKHCLKYNTSPTSDSLEIDLDSVKNITETTHNKSLALIKRLFSKPPNFSIDWITEETETFCKNRALEIAILKSVDILQDPTKNKSSIPFLMENALAVGFDRAVGINLSEDLENRWELYQNQWKDRLKVELDDLNTITDGGFPKGSLIVYMAGTGVGKSLTMCSHAAHAFKSGKNVLYISMELSDYIVSQRIEANLTDLPVNELRKLPKEIYVKKLQHSLKQHNHGRLIIKKYPTSSASASDFKNLISDLKRKHEFVPDVILVDYINICNSYRVRSDVGSYTFVKNIAEELRQLADETNTTIITATQITRDGYDASALSLRHVSESKALVETADFVAGLLVPPELKLSQRLVVEVMKNRFNDNSHAQRFICEIDRPRMRLRTLDSPHILQTDADLVIEEDHISPRSRTKSKKFSMTVHN